MSSALFVSEEGKKRVRAWCERFRAALPFAVEDAEVSTRYGRTHALIAGPPEGRPLVILHGALTSSAHVLGQLDRLSSARRIYALDIVGQSVWSEDRRVDVRGGHYGHWLLEACDRLGLQELDVIGVSYGGFVGLRAAMIDSSRIRTLMLLAPAGVVAGGLWAGLWEIGWPVLAYRFFPSRRRLERAMESLFTAPDPQWKAHFAEALRAYRLDLRLPPVATDEEMRRVACRTLVLASELDANFPADRMVARFRALLPRVQTEVLPGCRHCPPLDDAFRDAMARRVSAFTESPA